MNTFKKRAVYIVLGVCSLSVIGILAYSNNIPEIESKFDTAGIIDSEVNNRITIDYRTAIDANRGAEDLDKYVLYGLNTESSNLDDSIDYNKESLKLTGNKKDGNIVYSNHKTVDEFIVSCNIAVDDISEVMLAHYVDDNYIVGVVVPKNDKKDHVVRGVSAYINKLNAGTESANDKFTLLNTGDELIIVMCDSNDTDKLAYGIKSYIDNIRKILRDTNA